MGVAPLLNTKANLLIFLFHLSSTGINESKTIGGVIVMELLNLVAKIIF